MKSNIIIFGLFVTIFSALVGILCGAPTNIYETENVAGVGDMVENVAIVGHDDFSATAVTQNDTYLIEDAGFVSDFGPQATGYVKTGPDLKVNGSDGPVALPYGSRVVITAHMNPASSEVGAMRDWWILKHGPYGWFYMWSVRFWDYIPDLTYIEPTTQARLGFISSCTLFDSATLHDLDLSKGTYTYYFGVDAYDGYLTGDDLEYDSVTITIY